MVDVNFFLGSLWAIITEIGSVVIHLVVWFILSIAPMIVIIFIGSLFFMSKGFRSDIRKLTYEAIFWVGVFILAVILFILSFPLLGTQGTWIGGIIGAVLAGLLVWHLSNPTLAGG